MLYLSMPFEKKPPQKKTSHTCAMKRSNPKLGNSMFPPCSRCHSKLDEHLKDPETSERA
jgi:hypothetical protein